MYIYIYMYLHLLKATSEGIYPSDKVQKNGWIYPRFHVTWKQERPSFQFHNGSAIIIVASADRDFQVRNFAVEGQARLSGSIMKSHLVAVHGT